MRVAVLAVPVLIGGIAVAVLVALSRAHLHLRRLWRDGIEVDGTCLRSYVKHRGVGTNARSIQHHVYELRTREGQQLRFEQAGGPATVVEGDTVYSLRLWSSHSRRSSSGSSSRISLPDRFPLRAHA